MRRNMTEARAAFDRLIREDIERWRTVVKTAKRAPSLSGATTLGRSCRRPEPFLSMLGAIGTAFRRSASGWS
jgi:hypothetical protein